MLTNQELDNLMSYLERTIGPLGVNLDDQLTRPAVANPKRSTKSELVSQLSSYENKLFEHLNSIDTVDFSNDDEKKKFINKKKSIKRKISQYRKRIRDFDSFIDNYDNGFFDDYLKIREDIVGVEINGSLNKIRILQIVAIYWSLPEDSLCRTYIREALEEKIGNNLDMKIFLFLFEDKATFKIFLKEEFSSRSLYGNFFKKELLISAFSSIKLQFIKSRKPVKPVFRRGYNDKGSLTLNHRRTYDKYDWSLTEKHQEIIEDRQNCQTLIELLSGFLS